MNELRALVTTTLPQPSTSRPVYAVSSVDNALHLVHLLARDGSLRVSDAAAELGVAKSTAHRLLGMLCYRGFAVQDGGRLYRLGPALNADSRHARPADSLCAAARPYLEGLKREVGETVHLVALRGTNVEFLTSLESSSALRIGSRAGAVMAAHQTSGGRALLAALSEVELCSMFPAGSPDPTLSWVQFRRSLADVQRRGYGISDRICERGVVAIAGCVRGPDGRPLAAVAISAPTLRLERRNFPHTAAALHHHIGMLEQELARVSAGPAAAEPPTDVCSRTWSPLEAAL